ncbi:MAG: hypothetical protein ACRDEA_19180 [Microcystaceae cyanobacterium]
MRDKEDGGDGGDLNADSRLPTPDSLVLFGCNPIIAVYIGNSLEKR